VPVRPPTWPHCLGPMWAREEEGSVVAEVGVGLLVAEEERAGPQRSALVVGEALVVAQTLLLWLSFHTGTTLGDTGILVQRFFYPKYC
jgi:hypothetical protein